MKLVHAAVLAVVMTGPAHAVTERMPGARLRSVHGSS